VAEYPFTTREATPGMMPFEGVAFQLIDLPPLSDQHLEPWTFDLIRRADLVWIVVEVAGSLDGLDTMREILGPKRIGIFPVGTPAPLEDRAGWLHKPALLVLTGMDRKGGAEDLEALRELLQEPWPMAPVSAPGGMGLEQLKQLTFGSLGIMRVYTKQPGKPPDNETPFTLEVGSTVGDLARLIHKDVLEEGDVVEIHV
jgi:ribosome-interacting GTPase 1